MQANATENTHLLKTTRPVSPSLSMRYVPVLGAARQCGVTSRTFKRWLASLGFVFPCKGPGRRILLAPESVVEAAIQKHSGRFAYSETQK